MEEHRIEEFVDCLLESWALDDDGDERVVKLTLHDLLMAVSRFEVMKDGQKALTMALCKKLQEHFDTKFSIKERTVVFVELVVPEVVLITPKNL